MRLAILCIAVCTASVVFSQGSRDPEVTESYISVPVVDPYEGSDRIPSDAKVLFNGTDLSEWQTPQTPMVGSMLELEPTIPQLSPDFKGSPAPWSVDGGDLVVAPGKGDIVTKEAFGSMQLHIEWLAPPDEGKEGQGYSNSGIFLMGLYEIQVLNSFGNSTYSNGQAGAVYKQREPLVNASRPVGEWQMYDIIFTAPVFGDSGRLVSPARVTVLHNGVLIQNNVAINGPTVYIGAPHYIAHAPKLPLRLQNHGDKVRYRNIWVREL